MSKKVEVAGNSYDSRTVVTDVERLNLPNHPRVNAVAYPKMNGDKHSGKLKVIVKIPFNWIHHKELVLEIESPRRIDAINAVVNAVKKMPMYRRLVPKKTN